MICADMNSKFGIVIVRHCLKFEHVFGHTCIAGNDAHHSANTRSGCIEVAEVVL